jgi:hypothetical protein
MLLDGASESDLAATHGVAYQRHAPRLIANVSPARYAQHESGASGLRDHAAAWSANSVWPSARAQCAQQNVEPPAS